tara:strand:- start:47 stop:595 length:549 start_codon:yes stop_codon:yes gene_type:complete
MAFSKIDTNGLALDSVDNTILDLASNFAFSGTVTGAGESNTPFFFTVGVSSSQALSNQTFTTLTNWNTPTKSTQGTFSSGVYTPGIAGKYFCYLMCDIGNMADTDRVFCRVQADSDGNGSFSQKGATGKDICAHGNADIAAQTTMIIDCTANTQIRAQGWHEYGANRNFQGGFFMVHLLNKE